ncbi:MAG: ShlB/FhaC/HecB family hemolysin secretion/activation protein [Xanthomonadaceae bacterium]|jgi:hemolysin activation/secretion protein|nr:ShlB/FhaC/HecB family hemolysin secretion/activation protein [Xanthomonadaceae bacterium]
MRRSFSLIALALYAAMYSAHAQHTPPDAGQSIRELQEQPPRVPSRPQQLELTVPDAEEPATAEDSGVRIDVQGFRLSGNSAFSAAELLPLLQPYVGRELTLGELQQATQRISAYYREHGYPLARAYLPAQEIDAGNVRIDVLEGRYGEIRLNNRTRVRDGVAATPLFALRPNDPVRAESLERGLLLLDDLPGVKVAATLQPGAETGATDLVIEATPAPMVNGNVSIDNHGNRFTGEYMLSTTFNIDNPLRIGDRLNVRLLGTNEDQYYYQLGYQLPVGAMSTQLGVNLSKMDYQLGKDFAPLDAHGTARIVSLFAVQPLVRSRNFSMYARAQLDHKRLRDDIDLYDDNNRKRSNVMGLSLSGNGIDRFGGGGMTSFSIGASHGNLEIQDPYSRWIDQMTARTEGSFNKVEASVARVQHLGRNWNLYARAQGQWTNDNLDSSEKFSLGGAYGVRAYPQGEASGDRGWLGTMELRYLIGAQWQVSAFVDHGEVQLNADRWSRGHNQRKLSAGGIGVQWAAHGWQAGVSAAWKIGAEEPQSDKDRSPRLWALIAYSF